MSVFVNPQSVFQLFKLAGEFLGRGMNVLGLGNELDVFTARQTVVVENVFKVHQFVTVENQQFVFVELNLQRDLLK